MFTLFIFLPILGLFVSVSEESKRQNDLFLEEQKRQQEAVGRIEKIEVQYEGPPGDQTIILNKNISTPYDCAKRKIMSLYFKRSTLYIKF